MSIADTVRISLPFVWPSVDRGVRPAAGTRPAGARCGGWASPPSGPYTVDRLLCVLPAGHDGRTHLPNPYVKAAGR